MLGHAPPVEDGPAPEVYFCPRDDCMEIFVNLTINSGKVDCAFYDLELMPMIAAFNKSSSRLLLEDENHEKNKRLYSGMKNIKVDGSRVMHNKFCIFDEQIVATGSFNPTQRGNYQNNNNLIVIHSKYISENYLTEFEELWDAKERDTPYNLIYLNERLIENYFCPDECPPDIIKKLIDEANESINFMTFSFTHDGLGDSLVAAHKRGVHVQGVFEKSQNSKYSEYEKLKAAGLDVRLDTNPANMHHKVFIIDNGIVVTGSANPTNNGLHGNDENILVLHDLVLASAYTEEFESVRMH